jgi:hypothetical protein
MHAMTNRNSGLQHCHISNASLHPLLKISPDETSYAELYYPFLQHDVDCDTTHIAAYTDDRQGN